MIFDLRIKIVKKCFKGWKALIDQIHGKWPKLEMLWNFWEFLIFFFLKLQFKKEPMI